MKSGTVLLALVLVLVTVIVSPLYAHAEKKSDLNDSVSNGLAAGAGLLSGNREEIILSAADYINDDRQAHTHTGAGTGTGTIKEEIAAPTPSLTPHNASGDVKVYRPVFMMHGVNGDHKQFDSLVSNE